MANSNTPFGLRPVDTNLGAPTNLKVSKFYVPSTDATAIGIGDPVKLAGSADADGVPTVTRAAVNDAIVGVMVGIEPVYSDLTVNYRKASTSQYVYVSTDPNQLYEVQEDSVGGALAATDVGLNASFVLGTVDTTTGNSKTMLDSSTKATTATLDLQIVRLAPRVDNAIGTNAKWIVKLNNTQYGNLVTGL